MTSTATIRRPRRVTLVAWPDRAPTCPACPGWTINVYPNRKYNGLWKVIAHNGDHVLNLDRLTQADVEAFDCDARWSAR
jgi:hypothetical protein